MRLEEIDQNLKINTDINEPDLVWLDAKSAPFSLHGTFYDQTQGCYIRMPQTVADTVSRGVSNLNRFPAGGRIRFITDSPFIGFRFVQKNRTLTPQNTLMGMSGFDVYRKTGTGPSLYYKTLIPPMGVSEGYSSPMPTVVAGVLYYVNFVL